MSVPKSGRFVLAVVLLIGVLGAAPQHAQPGAVGSSIDELTARIARAPTSALYSARGGEHLRQGHAQVAVDDYSAAIRLRLDDPEPWAGRGRALIELGRFNAAIDDLDQSIRLAPDALPPHLDRGFAYGQNHDFSRAIRDFDLVLARERYSVASPGASIKAAVRSAMALSVSRCAA